MTPINPDEALYAFVDGELELAEEQQLFDALASHPELRTEMKDVLAIRNAVHRDVLFPSATAETALLAATGLVAPVGAAAVAGGSTLLARLLYAGGGILAGVIIAYLLFDVTGTSKTLQDQQALLNSQLIDLAQMRRAVQDADARAGASVEPARIETVYVKVPGKVLPTQPTPVGNNGNLGDGGPPAPEFGSTPSTELEPRITPMPTRTLFASDASTMSSLFSQRRTIESNPLTPGSSDLSSSVRLRTLPSSLQGEPRIPASVNDAILPNTSFAFLVPLSSSDRMGFEFGLDAFHQKFTSVRDGRPIEVDQTPVLYWVGGTYEVSPIGWEFIIDGLRPYGTASLGYAFSQGPVGHFMVGFQYQPVGPVRFTAGIDGAGLIFKDMTNWFASTKWGFTYGLSVDIGAIE